MAACKNYASVYGDNELFNPAWLLKLETPLILWGANYYSSKLQDMSGWLVWDKMRPDDLDQATCELAWTNCIKGVRRFKYLWNGMIRSGNDCLYHPTQKPKALMIWCMNLKWTKELSTVFDPYMGSGTTLIAAEHLGRQCFGLEIEPRYCDVIVQRWENLTGKKASRDDES